jgi:hypothetical protein
MSDDINAYLKDGETPLDVIKRERRSTNNLLRHWADRIRELESINADLYEALVVARNEIRAFPKSMGYDITTLPVIDAAIAKARGEER